MIVVADSGSTKCDWVFINNSKEMIKTSTMGFNPFFHSTELIENKLKENTKKYKYSCNEVVILLKNNIFYSDLTVMQVRDLLTWSDSRFNRDDFEWKFGEDLFGELEKQ